MKTEISAYLYNKKLQKVLQSVPEYVKIIQWAQNPIKYKKERIPNGLLKFSNSS